MIRINLLPFRAARKKENIRRQLTIFALSARPGEKAVVMYLPLGFKMGLQSENELFATTSTMRSYICSL